MLIALVARAAAAPAPDPRAEAIRYANALTGVDPDDDDDDDDDDGDDEEDGDDCSDQDCADAEAADPDASRGAWDDGRQRTGAEESRADDEGGDDDERADGLLAEDDDVRRLFAEDDDAQDGREAVLAGSTTGDLAALEAGAGDPGIAAGDDVSFAAASAGAAETYESWMRHQRPSPWGRLDLGVAWRRRWSEPMQAMSRRYDEVWLVATWRR